MQKIIYLTNLLDEFAPYWKTAMLEKNIWRKVENCMFLSFTYAFQSESALYSSLNVKESLPEAGAKSEV